MRTIWMVLASFALILAACGSAEASGDADEAEEGAGADRANAVGEPQITIDGDPGDWNGLPPIWEDPLGDNSGGSIDLLNISAYSNESDFFGMIWFEEPGQENQVLIWLGDDAGDYDYMLVVDSPGGSFDLLHFGSFEPADFADIAVSISEGLEFRINREDLGGIRVAKLFVETFEPGEEFGDVAEVATPPWIAVEGLIELPEDERADSEFESEENGAAPSISVEVPDGALVFQDDFEDGHASYLLFDEPNSRYVTLPMEDGNRVLTFGPSSLRIGSQTFAQYTVSLRVLFSDYGDAAGLILATGSEITEVGVAAGAVDNIVAGQATASMLLEPDTWYQVQLAIMEEWGLVSIDGEPVLQFPLTGEAAEAVYLAASGTGAVLIDDLALADLSEDSPYFAEDALAGALASASAIVIDGSGADWQGIPPLFSTLSGPSDPGPYTINEVRAIIYGDDLLFSMAMDGIDEQLSVGAILFYQNGLIHHSIGFNPEGRGDVFSSEETESAVGEVIEARIPLWLISDQLPDGIVIGAENIDDPESYTTAGLLLVQALEAFPSYHVEFTEQNHVVAVPENIADLVNAIVVDGRANDWEMIPTSGVDAEGDNAQGAADYGEVKAFCTEDRFYFMMDFHRQGRADIYAMSLGSNTPGGGAWLEFVPRSELIVRRDGLTLASLFRHAEFSSGEVIEFWVELDALEGVCPLRMYVTSQHDNNEFPDDSFVDFSIPVYPVANE